MTTEPISDIVVEEMTEIILADVEHPKLRRLVEHLCRRGEFQKACIIKGMYAKALPFVPTDENDQ